ncbi:unnamed protein product [Cercopithifilaria johnstoni]|uniref:Uncharacterized protein n=1 Tax=Cercopithifilaria johnstoni TaxID=2874296 RepID=A0A8J2M8H2_9BILA|nr:unnamed protein product [Cercopithifilaria johnstoni]
MSTNDTADVCLTIPNSGDGERKPGVHRNVSMNRFQVSKLNIDSNDLPASSSIADAAETGNAKPEMHKAASEPPPLSHPTLKDTERKNSAMGRFEKFLKLSSVVKALGGYKC